MPTTGRWEFFRVWSKELFIFRVTWFYVSRQGRKLDWIFSGWPVAREAGNIENEEQVE